MGTMSVHEDSRGERHAVAVRRDLLGTIGLVLSSQGVAAACVLGLALVAGWLAWSLVALMVAGGLALCALTGSLSRRA